MFEFKKHSMGLFLKEREEFEKRAFAPELIGGIARMAVPIAGQMGLYKAIEHSFKPNAFSKAPVVGRMLRGMSATADQHYKPGQRINPAKTNTMIADMVGPMAASAVAEPFISKFESSFQPKPVMQPRPNFQAPSPSFQPPSFNQGPTPSFQPPKPQSYASMAPSNILSQYGQ